MKKKASEEPAPAPKKRGRPAKPAAVAPVESDEEAVVSVPKKKKMRKLNAITSFDWESIKFGVCFFALDCLSDLLLIFDPCDCRSQLAIAAAPTSSTGMLSIFRLSRDQDQRPGCHLAHGNLVHLCLDGRRYLCVSLFDQPISLILPYLVLFFLTWSLRLARCIRSS